MTNGTEAHKEMNPAIEAMFKAGAHFAYSKTRRHPSAKPFIFGVKNRVEIFDLEKTLEQLNAAKDYVRSLGEAGSTVLFVGGKNEAKDAIKAGAELIGMPYVAGRWIGGTITNFSEIRGRVEKMEDLISKREKGELAKYTKKERLIIDREIDKLKEMFSGLSKLKAAPKALFIVDAKREHNALEEANAINIPVVSLSGSDCDLTAVKYAIPANDSALRSVKLFVDEIVGAYREGVALAAKKKLVA